MPTAKNQAASYGPPLSNKMACKSNKSRSIFQRNTPAVLITSKIYYLARRIFIHPFTGRPPVVLRCARHSPGRLAILVHFDGSIVANTTKTTPEDWRINGFTRSPMAGENIHGRKKCRPFAADDENSSTSAERETRKDATISFTRSPCPTRPLKSHD